MRTEATSGGGAGSAAVVLGVVQGLVQLSQRQVVQPWPWHRMDIVVRKPCSTDNAGLCQRGENRASSRARFCKHA